MALQKETTLNLITETCKECEAHRGALSLRGKGITLSPVKTNSFEKTTDKTVGGTKEGVPNVCELGLISPKAKPKSKATGTAVRATSTGQVWDGRRSESLPSHLTRRWKRTPAETNMFLEPSLESCTDCARSTSFPVSLQKGGRWHFWELLKYGPLSTR